MQEEIEVRRAELDDADGLARVHVLTWQSAYKGQMPDEVLDALNIDERAKRWLDKLSAEDEGATFVATLGGRVVGFCSVGRYRDDDSAKTTGELWAIYVDPEVSGRGVGVALEQQGIDYLRGQGYQQAALWVLSTNQKSINWYQNRGWRADDTTKMANIHGAELKEDRMIKAL